MGQDGTGRDRPRPGGEIRPMLSSEVQEAVTVHHPDLLPPLFSGRLQCTPYLRHLQVVSTPCSLKLFVQSGQRHSTELEVTERHAAQRRYTRLSIPLSPPSPSFALRTATDTGLSAEISSLSLEFKR